MPTLPSATRPPFGENFLDSIEEVFGDQVFVATREGFAFVGDDADVVRIPQ
jgi:hypothetical protein